MAPCDFGQDVSTVEEALREKIEGKTRFFYRANNTNACHNLVGKQVKLFAPENHCVDADGYGDQDIPERYLEALPLHAQ